MDNQTLILDKNQDAIASQLPKGAWLSNPDHVRRLIEYTTFWRRNPEIFAKQYLGITLYPYQELWLHEMFNAESATVVGSRAIAKTMVAALFACEKAILYPGTQIVVCSATKPQGAMLVAKIQSELCRMSPMLRREISEIKKSQNDTSVHFKNGSTIFCVVLSENARGYRANIMIVDEARQCSKETIDTVIVPMLVVQKPAFMYLRDYDGDERFITEPSSVYISSATDDQHWLYHRTETEFKTMMSGGNSIFLALDYTVTLRHGIKTRKQLIRDIRQFDPVTARIEYFNQVLKQNSKAYYKYAELKACQTLTQAFYPRRDDDVIGRVKNKYAIPKLPGEVRIVAADFAFVNRTGNDNSSFSCLRLIPDGGDHGQKVYRVQVPHMEIMRGSEMKRQAIRILQLKADFQADYLVLDLRNGGVSAYDLMARVLHDPDRGVDYPPLRAMNDEVIAARVNNPDADSCIYCITASLKLNSEIAVNFKMMLLQHLIEFLVPRDEAVAELRKFVPAYNTTMDPDEIYFWERPYLETALMVAETVNLQYERMENTGQIKIHERGNATKDRYTSVSYGAFFASMLARDLLCDEDNLTLDTAPLMVSTIPF